MLLGAVITLLALWILYIVDEERFHGAQEHAERMWNVTVAALPLQLVETGQKCKEVSKSTIGFVWSKTEAVYIWVNTNPTVKEYFELGRALLQVLYAKIYDLCRTVNQQSALYVETLKNKIFWKCYVFFNNISEQSCTVENWKNTKLHIINVLLSLWHSSLTSSYFNLYIYEFVCTVSG